MPTPNNGTAKTPKRGSKANNGTVVHSIRVPLSDPLVQYLSLQATCNGTSVGAEVVQLLREGLTAGAIKPAKKLHRHRAYATQRLRVPLPEPFFVALHLIAVEHDAPFPAAVKAAIAQGIRTRGVDLSTFTNKEPPCPTASAPCRQPTCP